MITAVEKNVHVYRGKLENFIIATMTFFAVVHLIIRCIIQTIKTDIIIYTLFFCNKW